MPPHCDTKDGPVVKAAQKALDQANVDLILPYVKKDGEDEIKNVFKKVMEARKIGGVAKEIADLYFFETVVRIHRAGEGAPYTGLKPAGLDTGPIIPIAEKVIDTSEVEPLIKKLSDTLEEEIKKRFNHLQHLKKHVNKNVDSAREYIEEMLGLQVWSHKLYLAIKSDPHEKSEDSQNHKH